MTRDQVMIIMSVGLWFLRFLIRSRISATKANVKVVKSMARPSGRTNDMLPRPKDLMPGNQAITLPRENAPPSENNGDASPTVAAPPVFCWNMLRPVRRGLMNWGRAKYSITVPITAAPTIAPG